MNKKRFWTVKEAQEYAFELGIEKSLPTIRRYLKIYNLGHPVGGDAQGKRGVWCVDSDKFMDFIQKGLNETQSTDKK